MTSGGAEDSVATVPVPIARKMKLDQQVSSFGDCAMKIFRLTFLIRYNFKINMVGNLCCYIF